MAALYVPLSLIEDSPFQPRVGYDAAGIDDLARSILARGQMQTPRARLIDHRTRDPIPMSSLYEAQPGTPPQKIDALARGVYAAVELVYGHRRRRAWDAIWRMVEAGEASTEGTPIERVPPGTMPVELAPLDDLAAFSQTVEENSKRKSLSALEEARSMDQAERRFSLTHEQIGAMYGLSRSAVSNKLRLLHLPGPIQDMNVEGLLSEGRARALVSLYTLPDAAREAYDIDGKLRWRLVEEVVARVNLNADGIPPETIRAMVAGYLSACTEATEARRREREPELIIEPVPSPRPKRETREEVVERLRDVAQLISTLLNELNLAGGKAAKELQAEIEAGRVSLGVELAAYAEVATAADVRAVCDVLGVGRLRVAVPEAAASGLNKRERKLLARVQGAGEAVEVRPGDVPAARALEAAGMIVTAGGWAWLPGAQAPQPEAETEPLDEDAPLRVTTYHEGRKIGEHPAEKRWKRWGEWWAVYRYGAHLFAAHMLSGATIAKAERAIATAQDVFAVAQAVLTEQGEAATLDRIEGYWATHVGKSETPEAAPLAEPAAQPEPAPVKRTLRPGVPTRSPEQMRRDADYLDEEAERKNYSDAKRARLREMAAETRRDAAALDEPAAQPEPA